MISSLLLLFTSNKFWSNKKLNGEEEKSDASKVNNIYKKQNLKSTQGYSSCFFPKIGKKSPNFYYIYTY